MKISVVIPAYNEADFITSCLNAIYSQTRAPDEIIVVDNASSDATSNIVATSFPEVILLYEPVRGTARARNRGYNHAKGDVIVRCDADCRPEPDWIERIESLFQNPRLQVVTGPTEFYDTPFKSTAVLLRCNDIMVKHLGYTFTYGPNHAFRKNVWKRIQHDTCVDDLTLHEDADLGYHMHQAGFEITVDPELVVPTSSRRLRHHAWEIFVTYPRRVEFTLKKHDPTTPFRFFVLYRALLPRLGWLHR